MKHHPVVGKDEKISELIVRRARDQEELAALEKKLRRLHADRRVLKARVNTRTDDIAVFAHGWQPAGGRSPSRTKGGKNKNAVLKALLEVAPGGLTEGQVQDKTGIEASTLGSLLSKLAKSHVIDDVGENSFRIAIDGLTQAQTLKLAAPEVIDAALKLLAEIKG
ncbi:MAG: hypothetical protein WDN76_04770 [Alphaproteobacteria bacterium]